MTKQKELKKANTAGNGEFRFGDVLTLWLENNQIHYKGATLNKYRYLIKTHILPQLGELKLSEIKSIDINTFLNEKIEKGRLDKKGGLSASYVRSMMLIIRSALSFAADENMCLPLKSPIYKPVLPKKAHRILSSEEQRRLENYLIQNKNATNIGVLLSLYSGLRIGEICALKWDDIDFNNNVIHVRHTVARVSNCNTFAQKSSKLIIDSPKTRASVRDIPILSMLLPSLREAFEKSNSNYVVSNSENFVSPRTFEYRYHCILKQCDLNSINFHMLRHTFATRCIQSGVDVKSLSEILGHSNISITLDTYVHSSIEMKRTQLEKLSLCPA